MDQQTYQLKLENLQLKLQQNPTQPNILQYLEARIHPLEEFLDLTTPNKKIDIDQPFVDML